MHFPSYRIGTTLATCALYMNTHSLHALYDDETDSDLSPEDQAKRDVFFDYDGTTPVESAFKPLLGDTIMTRESVGEMAVSRLNRSQESFSMGDAYYENIGYLNFLNDDFNDRSIHHYHACSMSTADLSETLALLVKETFNKVRDAAPT